jgi:hypothetical protein
LTTRADEIRATTAKSRAEASFKKEERAKEGAKAMVEYQTNTVAVREQMARLKALRLAKEAEVAAKGGEPAAKTGTSKTASKSKLAEAPVRMAKRRS